jgi:hypothetical protein
VLSFLLIVWCRESLARRKALLIRSQEKRAVGSRSTTFGARLDWRRSPHVIRHASRQAQKVSRGNGSTRQPVRMAAKVTYDVAPQSLDIPLARLDVKDAEGDRPIRSKIVLSRPCVQCARAVATIAVATILWEWGLPEAEPHTTQLVAARVPRRSIRTNSQTPTRGVCSVHDSLS